MILIFFYKYIVKYFSMAQYGPTKLYFSGLPIEMQMMIFDHLVQDETSLATVCLVSHNWKTITYASSAWKLLIDGHNSKDLAKDFLVYLESFNMPVGISMSLENLKPILCAIFNKDINDHRLLCYFRKFFFVYETENINYVEWIYSTCYAGRLPILKNLCQVLNIL